MNKEEKIIKTMNDRIDALESFEKVHLQLHREMMEQLQPITEVFNNINGFRKLSIFVLKALILIGGGLGVIYEAIKFFKSN